MGFSMVWFELHIRNCGAVQWLFTIWGRGKGSSETVRGHISEPYQTVTQVIKSSASRSQCRACWPHSREGEVFLWKGRNWRTHRHWKSWYKFPRGMHLRRKKFSDSPSLLSSLVLPSKPIKPPLTHVFLIPKTTLMMLLLVHHEAPTLGGDTAARIISERTQGIR